MGKGRKPCCDKAGVKRGPWSQAEDFKLISFIQKHGHSNWRALPQLAGLARCGKSCRLRWVNYLRPDLKRGNFTPQEEEAIIKLHEILGNKWSKIASHFPGRTDNEIKNVWNTHLKKRLKTKGFKDCTPTPSKVTLDEPNNVQWSNQETQGSTSTDIMEYSSSSSANSLFDIENCGEQHREETNICMEKGDRDSINELIEIPYEPNLDLWDLLHGENAVQLNDVDTSISENDTNNNNNNNDNKNNDIIEEDGESWWWLLYLESELGQT